MNGPISTAGFPADLLTGFGYLPPHLVENSIRRKIGYSDLSPDEQGWIDTFTSDRLKHYFENHGVGLHKPETGLGRYAETIGEMLPMLLLGETAGARLGGAIAGGWNAGRAGQGIWMGALRGAQSTPGIPMRELPATVFKHAAIPGAAIQTLQEEFPESKAGKTLQKVYPIARKAIPYVPAVTRYLGKRIVPY